MHNNMHYTFSTSYSLHSHISMCKTILPYIYTSNKCNAWWPKRITLKCTVVWFPPCLVDFLGFHHYMWLFSFMNFLWLLDTTIRHYETSWWEVMMHIFKHHETQKNIMKHLDTTIEILMRQNHWFGLELHVAVLATLHEVKLIAHGNNLHITI